MRDSSTKRWSVERRGWLHELLGARLSVIDPTLGGKPGAGLTAKSQVSGLGDSLLATLRIELWATGAGARLEGEQRSSMFNI